MSITPIKLIVGLGNPGPQYEKTRHNAGAWFIDYIAEETQAILRSSSKFQGLHALTRIGDTECHLLIPTTFMNLSGQSVQRVANYYKIPPNAILIAHDEVDLGVGDTRLKWDGGDGGHNGVKDIIRHLATKQFLRLRIGVGRPHHKNGVEEYVLMPPKKIEFDDIMRSLVNAYDILPLLLAGQVQKAMHQLHTEG